MPQVSIIVPVYNEERYLRECLDSILNQSCKDIEIICVNDGSSDNSAKIIEEYSLKDKRIKVIMQRNEGLSCARNRAIAEATGKYILCVDADDYIRTDAIEILYNKAVKFDLDMLSFSAKCFNDTSDKSFSKAYYEFRYLPDGFNTDCFNYKDCSDFMEKMAVTSGLTLYKLGFIKGKDIKFPPHLYFEDNLFFIKSLCSAKRCGILKDIMYYKRIHHSSITQNWCKYYHDYIKVFEMLLEYLKSIKIDDKIYKRFQCSCSKKIVAKYNEFDEKYQDKYYRRVRKFAQKHCPEMLVKIEKPKNILARLFVEIQGQRFSQSGSSSSSPGSLICSPVSSITVSVRRNCFL